MMNKSKELPEVSIIVPVFNRQYTITELLDSLMTQSYPKSRTKILIVDNKSTDNTVNIIKKYPVTLLHEDKIQSSYAARNKGIEKSKSEVLAFIDSDCKARKDWLLNGIDKLLTSKSDITGGNIRFRFSKNPTETELYDSAINMDNETCINTRNVAKTANLFVRKDLFKKIGLFNSKLKSGGDIEWTQKATEKGFKITYAKDAIVYHPARKLRELIKKQIRVEKGKGELLLKRKKYSSYFKKFVFSFKPPAKKTIDRIHQLLIRKKYSIEYNRTKMYLVIYIIKVISGINMLSSLL